MIVVDNLNIEFIQYKNLSNNLKENFINYILNFGQNRYKNEKFQVLKDINFQLNDGDRLAIIGRNGAGKTTLLKSICGIYRPKRGVIKIDGKISSLIEIGAGFNPELTGRENIYLNGLIMGFSKRELQRKEREIIEFADIGDFIDTPMKYYSTGMNMRLSLSIATNIEPEILIVDELFAGGDIGFIKKAQERIKKMITNSKIFITAPHNMSYVRELCNRVLYLKSGRVKYFGDDIERGITLYERDNLKS